MKLAFLVASSLGLAAALSAPAGAACPAVPSWAAGRTADCKLRVNSGISSLGVMIFGVWLAIYLDAYELWDGWIISSLVLWAIATGVGQRSGVYFQRAAAPDADVVTLRRTGLYLQLIANASLLLILILMIFKPGA